MKTLILITIYVISFTFFYLLISLPLTLVCGSYKEIITNEGWFTVYSILIGWWISIFPAREYYIKKEKDFENIF